MLWFRLSPVYYLIWRADDFSAHLLHVVSAHILPSQALGALAVGNSVLGARISVSHEL
jgi:hypothetical protein